HEHVDGEDAERGAEADEQLHRTGSNSTRMTSPPRPVAASSAIWRTSQRWHLIHSMPSARADASSGGQCTTLWPRMPCRLMVSLTVHRPGMSLTTHSSSATFSFMPGSPTVRASCRSPTASCSPAAGWACPSARSRCRGGRRRRARPPTLQRRQRWSRTPARDRACSSRRAPSALIHHGLGPDDLVDLVGRADQRAGRLAVGQGDRRDLVLVLPGPVLGALVDPDVLVLTGQRGLQRLRGGLGLHNPLPLHHPRPHRRWNPVTGLGGSSGGRPCSARISLATPWSAIDWSCAASSAHSPRT